MKLTIVDEADNVIGAKDKGELVPSDIYRVARLVIVNSQGQVLLASVLSSRKKLMRK